MADYTQLEADIRAWLWRDDAELLNVIPTLIKFAHNRNNRNLRIRPMMYRAETVGPDPASRFIPLPSEINAPAEFLEMRSLRIKSVNYDNDQLIQVTPEALRISQNTKPGQYCIHQEIEFDSPVSAEFTIEMTYYGPFPELLTPTSTNWLLENAYDVYLYGALQEAEPFLRNDERIPVWSGRWSAAIEELREAEKRSLRNRSEIRTMLDPQEYAP